MEIRTFTQFWTADMKMYSVNDIALPVPISMRVLGVFIATAIPWWGILALFHVPLAAPWHIVWIIVPGGIAFLASGNFFEKKTLFQYIKARIGHIMEEKRYKGLQKDLNRYDEEVEQGVNIILPFSEEDRHDDDFVLRSQA